MKIKIIIISCLLCALMLGLNFAQTNEKRRNNSNSGETTNREKLSDNSNTANVIRANQEKERDRLAQVACQYLTQREAKLILQNEVYANGNLTSYIDKNYFCNYSAVGGKSTDSASVRLDIKVFATKTEAENAVAEKVEAARLIKLKESNSGISNATTMTDIGDSAQLMNIGNDSLHLYFRKEITVFELSVSNLRYTKMTLKSLKALARKVAETFSPEKAEQRK